MSEEEKNKEPQFSSAKEVFEHNQQQIVRKKEEYYDKVIGSLNLTKGKLDIIIIGLIIAVIVIVIIGLKNR
ncbi:MAG: hypothetical protein IKH68_01805 [Erysipelotrichaceae bacterium]|nr:hypothetical protein [Erysipelotrichaceae bacterium]